MRPPLASPRSHGFTLIEMVIVVMIVGILASAAMPLAALHKRRAKEAELHEALRTVRTALDDYKLAADAGRILKATGDTGYPPKDVTTPEGKKIYFLRRLPRDPFADPTSPAAETWGLRSYSSPPDAPQPGADVFDVYSRATGVGLDGSAYRTW